ncbi:unnamed protein product [Sphagnum tenellum]
MQQHRLQDTTPHNAQPQCVERKTQDYSMVVRRTSGVAGRKALDNKMQDDSTMTQCPHVAATLRRSKLRRCDVANYDAMALQLAWLRCCGAVRRCINALRVAAMLWRYNSHG